MDKTPKHHGEFYFEPNIAQWPNAVLQNRAQFFDIPLWGQTASKVRAFLKMPTVCPLFLPTTYPVDDL